MFKVLPSKYAFAAYYVSIWSPSVCLHSIIHTLANAHTYEISLFLSLSLSLYYTLLYRLMNQSSWRPRKGECLWLALYIAHPLNLAARSSLSLSLTHTYKHIHKHPFSLSILCVPMFLKNVCFCAYGLSSSVYTAREVSSLLYWI